MPSYLKIDFLHKPDEVALGKGRVIKTMLPNHPYSAAVGSSAVDLLGTVIDRLQVAGDEARCRDTNKVRARKEVRVEFNNAFRNTARSIESWASGDITKLQNTGYDTRETAKKASGLIALLAPILSVTHAPIDKTLLVGMSAVKGAVLFELEIATGDPALEESWTPYDMYVKNNRTKIQVTNRVPGQLYWLRGRCFGVTGYGPYSQPVSIRSL